MNASFCTKIIFFANEATSQAFKRASLLCSGSTVVEHSTHKLKVKGLDPATDNQREKLTKMFGNVESSAFLENNLLLKMYFYLASLFSLVQYSYWQGLSLPKYSTLQCPPPQSKGEVNTTNIRQGRKCLFETNIIKLKSSLLLKIFLILHKH